MEYICCGLIWYFIGTINPSYFIAKRRGFDIRTKGSGNAGASNALILFGKLLGIICALLDIAKAYLAILLTEALFPEFRYAYAITGVACVIGHIFPFYMKFKGGKGLVLAVSFCISTGKSFWLCLPSQSSLHWSQIIFALFRSRHPLRFRLFTALWKEIFGGPAFYPSLLP